MTPAPQAIAAATKQAAMKARIAFLRIFVAVIPHSGTDGFAPADKRPCSSRKGKGLRFDLDENSPKQADRSVKAGRFGIFEIDEEALDPR